jgi:hypothetical protein
MFRHGQALENGFTLLRMFAVPYIDRRKRCGGLNPREKLGTGRILPNTSDLRSIGQFVN